MDHHDGTFESALTEVPGIPQPPSTNDDAIKRFLAARRQRYTTQEFVDGICAGNRTILSQAITLVESSLPQHQAQAQQIIEGCLPHSGKSIRIGITGVPGAGKSTFIESFGCLLTKKGHKLAVLAIDPSSERSKGSILGDKTRMEQLSCDPNAYIRPSPSAGSLGGVARKTRESVILCEAAGFDVIFIETVGVGQSETAVHSMVDFFLLLMLAGAGDELQGIKRGIMEMADTIAITKSDGANVDRASMAKAEYQSALHLFPSTASGWKPVVHTCSSLENTGLTTIWETIQSYVTLVQQNGYFVARRNDQARFWMHESINEKLQNHFFNNDLVKHSIDQLTQRVVAGEVTSFIAAQQLFDLYQR